MSDRGATALQERYDDFYIVDDYVLERGNTRTNVWQSWEKVLGADRHVDLLERIGEEPPDRSDRLQDVGPAFTDFDYYLANALFLSDPFNFETSRLPDAEVDGKTVEVWDLRAEQAVKIREPHRTAGYRVSADPERQCLLKVEEYDPNGQIIATTTYSDLVQLADGAWRPTKTYTKRLGGMHRVSIQMHLNNEDVTLEVDVPLPDTDVRTEYVVLEGKHVLPGRTVMLSGDGSVRSSMVFRDYVIGPADPVQD